MKKYIYLSILIVLFLSCKGSKVVNEQDIDFNCEEMVVAIVRSSSLDWKRFPNASTRIDRVENDSIFIKVFFDMDISDEPNSKQVVENSKENKLPNTGMNTTSTTALGLSLIALVGAAVRRKLSE